MRFQSNLNEIIEADETLEGQLTIPQTIHMESHNTVSFFSKKHYKLGYLIMQEIVYKMAMPDEERVHGTVSVKTYLQYFIGGGGYLFNLFVLAIFVVSEVSFYIVSALDQINFVISQMLLLLIGG